MSNATISNGSVKSAKFTKSVKNGQPSDSSLLASNGQPSDSTLDVSAVQPVELTAEELMMTELAKLDPATVDDLREAIRLYRETESVRTVNFFLIAGLLVQTIKRNVLGAAKTVDDAADFREQSLTLFSNWISRVSGLALNSKKMTEFVRALYLDLLLSTDPQSGKVDPRVSSACAINWEVVRVLNKWMVYDAKETVFEPRVGSGAGTYAESWTIKAGCEDRLRELVHVLAKFPKSPKVVRELMDDHETELDNANLATMKGAQRRKEMASRETAAKAARNKEVDSFYGNLLTRAATLELSPEELSSELVRRGIVMMDGLDPATMTAEEGTAFGLALLASKNDDAIGAIFAAVKPRIIELGNLATNGLKIA